MLARIAAGRLGRQGSSGCLPTQLARALSTTPSAAQQQGGGEDDSPAYWQRLLLLQQQHGRADATAAPTDAGGAATAAAPTDDARRLLQTALRFRQNKPQSAVPEQLIAVFVQFYGGLPHHDRISLLRGLVGGFGVQAAEVDSAAAAWQALRRQQLAAEGGSTGDAAAAAAGGGGSSGPQPMLKAAAALSAAATPAFARLLGPLAQQPGGIQFLVDMRAELLQAIQEQPSGAAPLRALSDALRASLAEWFSVGLLQLQRISWEESSAELLEKVAAGEAVHALAGWADLKARLASSDRRVYAFIHQAMPGAPLVVLHTALTSGVASSMAQLLPGAAAAAAQLHRRAGAAAAAGERTWEQQRAAPPLRPLLAPAGEDGHPGEAGPTTAVFYSISATQPGLAGVDLGNFLIKQAARRVQTEFPSVRTLCTLSPLPGFAAWVRVQLARVEQRLPAAVPLLLPDEAAALEAAAAGHLPPAAAAAAAAGQQQADAARSAALLGWALGDDAWLHSGRLEAALRPPLLRLAAHYLLRERRRGLALDPVANFHLRNGAAALRLNWRADLSPPGLGRSHGIMVNYHYELDRLADNNRAYVVDGVVSASPEVRACLRERDGEQPPAAAGVRST